MKERGFTLIEVVASLVIVGISLVAILGMFSIGSRSSAFNQDNVVACSLLQRKLEEVKCKGFDDINSNDDDEVITVNNSTYTLNVEVDSLDVDLTDFVGENPPLKRVRASVTWATLFGNSRTETLYTLIANHG